MGLGLHGGGLGATEFFVKTGARVTVTDLRTQKQLKESIEKLKGLPIKYVLGRHREEDFQNTDLIIRNPAVPDDSPYLKIAQKHKIPIDTDVGIFFELCPAPIVGITGTRGKSTSATLIYEFLKTKYKNAILAGNIRKSVLLELPHIIKNSIVILELSSWQLEGLKSHKKSPHIAVITNIQPDHLNRYKGMGDYIEAKKLIFKYQTKNDFLFLNKDDKIVRSFSKQAKSKVIFYSAKNAKKYKTNLLGLHNLANIAAAVKVAKHLGVGDNLIRKVLRNFRGLEGRIQQIAKIKGVKYINDTTATTPDATIAAIAAINCQLSTTNKLILIAGGADKNLNFDKLAKIIAKNVKTLILLPGTATTKFKKSIEQLKVDGWKLDVHEANSMSKAVKIAYNGINSLRYNEINSLRYNMAKAGDVVLLSPACASFGLFRHEFERGKKFIQAVRNLKQ